MDARVKPGHDESIDRGTSLGLLSGSNSVRRISHYRPTTSMYWPKVAARNMRGDNSVGESGMYLVAVIRAIRAVLTHHRYRPELHYMRGPGPKWFERHGR
jgi:hypothetical protein